LNAIVLTGADPAQTLQALIDATSDTSVN